VNRGEGQRADLTLREVETGGLEDGYYPVRLVTARGEVDCRHYRVPGARRAALWVGGVGGGWDTPARGLYPRLCEDLTEDGITSLRVRFRYPADLDECVMDLLAGLYYLRGEGVEVMGLVGHSLGGAVVIQAAEFEPVRTVVALSTQSYGAAAVSALAPRCSLLLIHGTADRVLPPSSSEYVFDLAGEPKRLVLYDGAGHVLDEVADDVYRVVREWIVDRLR
jgi:pimeloyl-ACP methyl ester carboxylesterase